jgi:hypothetical protein
VAQGFTNNGLIELTSVVNGQSSVLIVNNGTLVNPPGGVINVLTGAGNNGRVINAELNNQGTLTVGASLSLSKSSAAHLNSGSILLTNGDLSLSQSGTPSSFTTTGIVDIGNGLNFVVSGGTLNYNAGTIGGLGTLSLNSATANFVPNFSNASTALYLNGATVNGPGIVTNAVGKTFSIDNSTLNAALINQGSVIFRGFGNNLNGSVENQAGATLRVQGDGTISGAQLAVAQGFTNNGLIELTSVVNGQSAVLIVNNGTLVNSPGGVINSLTGAGNNGRGLNTELNNQGTLNVGATLTINKGPGAVYSDGGTINVSAGQTLQVIGGTFQINTGGVLQGNGTVDVSSISFTNSGTVRPGAPIGSLSVIGAYPQSAGGALDVQIGGRSAGIDYDQLQVSGNAILNGTLNITLTNGFRPVGGDRFEVARYGSHQQLLDHINGLDIGGGLFLEPAFSATNLVLVTIDTRPQVVFETPKLLSGGAIQITLDGTAGRDFVIEATTNLAPAIWTPIVTNTNSGAVFNLILIDVTNFPVRFFRFKQ